MGRPSTYARLIPDYASKVKHKPSLVLAKLIYGHIPLDILASELQIACKYALEGAAVPTFLPFRLPPTETLSCYLAPLLLGYILLTA